MFGNKKTDDEKAAKTRANQLRAAGAAAGVTIIGGKAKAPNQQPVVVEGAKVTIERGEEAGKRVTATRVLLTGVFALLIKKDRNQLFITIEGADGSVLLQPVPARKEAQARVFATLVNGESTGVTKTD